MNLADKLVEACNSAGLDAEKNGDCNVFVKKAMRFDDIRRAAILAELDENIRLADQDFSGFSNGILVKVVNK